MLTPEEKRELLQIAREAIVSALGGTSFVRKLPVEGALVQPTGAFVTIRIENELRGCIGYVESNRPLAEVVAEVAVKASLEDPRFPPLTPAELDRATLEVSILSPLQLVDNIERIEVGVHGLMLEWGDHRGLLLPQVAVEQRWDRETFVRATAKKAGLPEMAWRHPDVRIYAFTAEVVQEADVLM